MARTHHKFVQCRQVKTREWLKIAGVELVDCGMDKGDGKETQQGS